MTVAKLGFILVIMLMNILNVHPPVFRQFLVCRYELFISVKLYALYLCKCGRFNIGMYQNCKYCRELRQHSSVVFYKSLNASCFVIYFLHILYVVCTAMIVLQPSGVLSDS